MGVSEVTVVLRKTHTFPQSSCPDSEVASRTLRCSPRRFFLRALIEAGYVDDNALVRAFSDAVSLIVRPHAKRQSPAIDVRELGSGDDVQAYRRCGDVGDVEARADRLMALRQETFDRIERSLFHQADHDRRRKHFYFTAADMRCRIARADHDFALTGQARL